MFASDALTEERESSSMGFDYQRGMMNEWLHVFLVFFFLFLCEKIGRCVDLTRSRKNRMI